MDFKDFKKNKDKFTKITQKLVKPSNNYTDSRFWTPTKDDAGNGEALIRFLPQKNVEKNPFVLNFQHFFKERGKWFVEKCPVTWEKECPICDYVQPFWDGTKTEKDMAGKYGRKYQYTANILVIKDPAKSENNGKVFLYKFGKKIFEKIATKISPTSELDKENIVYDLWEGMDFKLKIKKVYGFPNYDDSEFAGEIVPVGKTDEEIENIYNSIHALDEFIDPKLCKSGNDLSDKFFKLIEKPNIIKNKNQNEKIESQNVEKDKFKESEKESQNVKKDKFKESEKESHDEMKVHGKIKDGKEEVKEEGEDEGKEDGDEFDWSW